MSKAFLGIFEKRPRLYLYFKQFTVVKTDISTSFLSHHSLALFEKVIQNNFLRALVCGNLTVRFC